VSARWQRRPARHGKDALNSNLTTARGDRESQWQWAWDSLFLAVAIATIGLLELHVARLGGATDPVFVDWLVLPWLPSGIAVAALLLRGVSRWPGVFVGEFVYTAIAGAAPPVVVLGAAAGTLGALATYTLLRTWRFNPAIEQWRDPPLLWAAAAIGGLCITGAYAAGFLLTAWLNPENLRPAYAAVTLDASGQVTFSVELQRLAVRWWVNVTAGVGLILPCMYACTRAGRRQINVSRTELLAMTLVFAAWIITYVSVNSPGARQPLSLVALLLVAWSSIRFGAGLTSFTTLVITFTVTAGFLLSVGPVHARSASTIVNVWAFIFMIAALGQLITALLAERNAAARRLVASETRYRALFDSNPQPLWVHDPKSLRILMANDAAVSHYGYSREEFTKLLATDLEVHDQPDNNGRTLSDTNEHLHRTSDGALITVELRSHPIEFDGRDAELVFSYDVTDRNRLRSALINATDRAARKLGQELHDGLGQELVGLSLITRSQNARVERGEAPDADVLGMMDHIAQRAVLACRNIAHGLSALTETGGNLAGALQKLPERYAAEGGPAISVVARNEVEPLLPDDALDHVYRIAQEALSNALKHARARHVDIRFDVSNTHAVLTIRDDGVGFSRTAARSPGLGLSSMRYRAEAIGARLFVTSPAEGGTEVRLECPQGAATPASSGSIAAQRTG
jgi:PAS domain S-box-containing protein